MWDFIKRNPWIAWALLGVVAFFLVAANAATIGALLFGLINEIIEHLALPLVILAMIVWGFARILGYGVLWGKRGGNKK